MTKESLSANFETRGTGAPKGAKVSLRAHGSFFSGAAQGRMGQIGRMGWTGLENRRLASLTGQSEATDRASFLRFPSLSVASHRKFFSERRDQRDSSDKRDGKMPGGIPPSSALFRLL